MYHNVCLLEMSHNTCSVQLKLFTQGRKKGFIAINIKTHSANVHTCFVNFRAANLLKPLSSG